MYAKPSGELPPQSRLLTGRATFTDAYAVIPREVMVDSVSSALPFWTKTKLWVLARPLSGFAETFSQYLMEVAPGGGSELPEPDRGAQAVLFVLEGELTLDIDGRICRMMPGGYAYLPPSCRWRVRNEGPDSTHFHWIRKRYDQAEGLDPPDAFVTREQDVASTLTAGTEGRWSAKIFVKPSDMRHDMHVNIITLQPGAVIPFAETHVMEHGLYILSGKGVYRLNQDWVEVEAGDYIWLRAFCPQACYAGGPEPFRYLLYKDVNRHAKLA